MVLTKQKKPNKIESGKSKIENDGDKWLEMFSIFIHDIESPLASIKYLLKILEDGKFNPENKTHQTILSSSKIALDRSESIIYDIMAVAKAGKIGLPVSVKDIVPHAVITEAILLAQSSAIERNIKLTYTNNAGNTPVKADPKLLKRVLDNLIINSLRHTPSGGTVAVYTDMEKGSLYIHVKDTGSGLGDIDPEIIFEKYGQANLRSQGTHRGVGLGLYFCKLAATGMGGTIMANDHEEGGAVFSIRLIKAEA